MRNLFNLFFFLFVAHVTVGQQNEVKPFSIEADYFYGSILEHNQDISHLITDFPNGLWLSYNRKTYGWNEWEGRYNFPDWGFTFSYQDLKNTYLGENYGLYGHFNWYFLNRYLRVTVGQGVAYASNPYHPDDNYENSAYGSRFLSSTFIKAGFVKENIIDGLGIQLNLGVLHYSNANLKAPNNSTNTLFASAGLSYQFDAPNFPVRIPVGSWRSSNYAERIHYNAVFRTGVNEAGVNGLGQFPFYTFSFFADKRINYKSTFQAGVDVYFSYFLLNLIRYREIAYPGDGLTGDEDFRRVGVFIGHELRFNKVAFVSQLGRYIYWPYEFENITYNRLGLKRYMFNEKVFVAVTVKAHWAKAEAVEFGLGVRL